jgi:hypothetical protein
MQFYFDIIMLKKISIKTGNAIWIDTNKNWSNVQSRWSDIKLLIANLPAHQSFNLIPLLQTFSQMQFNLKIKS